MRAFIAIMAIGLVGSACTKGAKEGEEEAKREAERLQKEKEAAGGVAKTIRPPVPGQSRIPCTQLLDATAMGAAIGEKEPLEVKDITKAEPEAAASCSFHRGGKRLNEKEQQALLKKAGRLGVLAGDELCNVTAFCWTIEDAERFKGKCKTRKDRDDESMGTYACLQVVAQGVDDVFVYRFFDEDTKCILQVRGGPSNVDNEIIRNCAKAARDQIGPQQIAVNPDGGAPAAAAGSAAGSDAPAGSAAPAGSGN
ncbi:MAG: hypothetical protein H0T89_04375 [Deltaproteobacteria bacterium]|nr:hypothetical protein [Deltaproteobacteria bacterium]MDQ3295685.1 hypothetical protein [Myxococcota bacterium]